MKKGVTGIVIIVSILFSLFSGCYFKEDRFCDVDIGGNFAGSRDGYCKKLPHNYCLDIDLGSTARLFKVADKYLNTVWDSAAQYDEIILKGHYIKGYYNENFLILCEEKSDGVCVYWSFDFFSNAIEFYEYVDEVYRIFEFSFTKWFTLCNTNAEIIV